MANVLVEESSLSAIADSIRAKNGTATTYKPAEMSGAIDALPTGGGDMQTKSVSYTPTETAQSGTVTPDVGYDGLSSVSVSVGAIDDEYVGSGITRRSIADLDLTGATFTAPAGYYASDADKTMMTGHMSVSATKGTVSNHSVSVTPKAAVDNAGYFATGDRTGTAVSVSASELVSGTKSITANGTGIDVTNYAAVDVAVSGQTPTGTKNISITANGTTTEDVAAYANAQITANVPNSYTAGDEGKVVDAGALVSQTSDTVTTNDTYDTTLINSLTVNVPTGGGAQTATGTINLGSAGNVATFSCSFEPKCICILADSMSAFATRHITDYYFHVGFAALIRYENANSTSKTNAVANVSTSYALDTTFSSYYKVSYSNGTVTVQGRSGYGFLAGSDTTYTWRAIGY